MTIDDIKEYKRNAVKMLRENSQYATAKATEQAFDALLFINTVVDMFNDCESGYPITYNELNELSIIHDKE